MTGVKNRQFDEFIVLLTTICEGLEGQSVRSSAQNILAEPIKSSFTTTEYVIRGARAYMFVLDSGTATLVTGDDAEDIEAPCLIWTPVGLTARLRLAAGCRGFVLRVPEAHTGRSLPSGSISGHVRSAIGTLIISRKLDARTLEKMRLYFNEIKDELFDAQPGGATAIQYCLSLLLIQVWRTSTPSVASPIVLPRQIVHDFLYLVELHMLKHWRVTQYAAHLGISKDSLNTAVRKVLQQSPHQYIQSRLINEAKTLLLNSDLKVSEIAYKLGFSDAAYFNRFFHRHNQISPGKFRSQNLPQDSANEDLDTFAAWP